MLQGAGAGRSGERLAPDPRSTRVNRHPQKWPDRLWLVRHGQSAGNVARELAEAAGHPMIDLPTRDVDVPLSALGERQSQALGRWFFQKLAPEERPTVVLTSPYVRARRTAEIALAEGGEGAAGLKLISDERLREREFGIFDRLTKAGIEAKFPEQAAMRAAIGKFYHRPPGGESWCDVILRLRSVVDTLTREHRRERVLIFAHHVVVFCFRYLLEQMTEAEILGIDQEHEVANCSITTYGFEGSATRTQGRLALQTFNFVAPLAEEGAPVTTRHDVPVAPK
jgi:broad specificity phosphatase PhoE